MRLAHLPPCPDLVCLIASLLPITPLFDAMPGVVFFVKDLRRR